MQRFVDAWMSFPDLIILIVVVSVVGPGMPQIIVTLGLLLGIAGSRIIRSAVVSVRENMYVHAAQSIGASTGRILWRHILPNVMPPIIVLFTTRVGTVILAEFGLSFLGLGVPPPAPTWGGMLSGSRPHLHVPGALAGAGAGPLPDRRRLCHQRVRRRACAICSIRACAARAEITKPSQKEGGDHVVFSHRCDLAAASVAVTLVARGAGVGRNRRPPPKSGGTLEIGTVYVTLSALSWDPADWNWKHNHDTGAVYEQLFVADLSKSRRQRRQASLLRRCLAAVGRHPRRTRRELGVEAESAAPRNQPAQGRDVSRTSPA